VGIRDFSAVRGMGNADHLWKTFGGANSNRLAIPLYVLIDKNSVIRYAGDGGEQLAELKREIGKVLSAGEPVGPGFAFFAGDGH
ncbi:MAG TPA: hypothetical protein VMZ26_09430, partial [Pyrinomonadaceae bacterium]|nr:hypothetical protein [Pyrinomonadaceae bacterium]